jgi:hypothetical protein
MTESIVQATVRLTIIGDSGRIDLAVPLWADIATITDLYVERTQSAPVVLHTPAGNALAPEATVHGSQLVHGDLLVAVSPTSAPPAPHEESAQPSVLPSPAATTASTAPLAPLAVVAIGLVVALGGFLEEGAARDGAAAGLLVVALLTVLRARGHRAVDTLWLAIVPVLVAAGAVVAASSTVGPTDDGGLLLVAAVAGLVAGATAGAVRSASPGVADDWMQAWMVTGVVVAASAASCLLTGWSPTTFWTFIVVGAVLAARIVPAYVVDVPDHVLLDFARLAVTAWTAREEPRRSFRGVVRRDDVEAVAHRALRLVAAASVIAAVAAVTATSALLLSDADSSRRIGIIALAAGTGAALTLGGRTLRVRTARHVQRTAGTLVLIETAVWLLVDLGASARPVVVSATILIGLLLVVVARSAGRGWTSVRWSRTAEICETLAGVIVFASLPLATGLFDWVRLLTSS